MRNNSPMVAVVTRTKDRPSLLSRAIESVHSQKFNDFIQIIINDGGDEDVVEEVVKRMGLAGNPRIIIIHNKKSNGMEAASNKAIRSISSEYIAIHDDDDTWHPEMLLRSIKFLNDNKSMGVVVRTNKVVEELQADGSVTHIKTTEWLPEVKSINIYRQCIDNQMTPITFIYRRSAYDDLIGYDESLPVCGDWDFGIRFMQKWDADYIDPGFALANYHQRKYKPGAEGNTSYAGNDKHRYWSNYLMNKYLREELEDGRLGVGFIMSKLRYDEGQIAMYMRRFLPISIVEKLKRRVRD